MVNDLDIVVVPKGDVSAHLGSKGIHATSGAEKMLNFD